LSTGCKVSQCAVPLGHTGDEGDFLAGDVLGCLSACAASSWRSNVIWLFSTSYSRSLRARNERVNLLPQNTTGLHDRHSVTVGDHAVDVSFFAPDAANAEAREHLPPLLEKRGVSGAAALATYVRRLCPARAPRRNVRPCSLLPAPL